MAVSIVMPRLGDFMMEGTVARWSKSSGDSVDQGEVIAEIETEKLNYDLEATESGILHQAVPEGAAVAVDGVMGYLLAEGEAAPEPPTPSAPAEKGPPARSRPAAPSRPAGDVVPSTPGARRLAANMGIDISQVTPTGPRGRVTDADVRAHAEAQRAPSIPPGLPEPTRSVPLEGMRKAIAGHMRDSLSATAQLSYFLDVDLTEIQRLRREASRDSGAKIGVPDVLVKACAEALKRAPLLNTVLSDGHVLHFDQINIGVAVALEDGLIVPVVRDAGAKGLRQIAEEIGSLAARARAGALSSDEVVGGTFTISVLGTVDGFTPILNAGQSALLGAGRPREKPVARDGQVVVREMMTLSLTADHQVVDGAVAAGFLRRLQSLVERPSRLFR